MGESVDGTDSRPRLLHAGVAVGAGGLITGIVLGAVANARPSGLGVAPVLASNSLYFRSAIILLYGCVALLIAILWPRLRRDSASVIRLRKHVTVMVILCGVGPVLMLVLNYLLVAGIVPHALALLPGLVAVTLAVLYALVVHQLSGTTGVGLGSRLMLRSSYIWLIIAAASHLTWIAVRVATGASDLLWFIERPVLEVAMIGFCITASLGVLVTNLNSIYHSRDMTQTLVRNSQITSGLTAMWGLSLLWALRFPGGYQGLASAVIGIALMIVLFSVAASSGLLDRRSLTGQSRDASGDGVWARRLASAVMLLTVITGLLIGASGVVLAGMGERPVAGVLAAELMSVGLGIVPLAVAAALAPMIGKRERSLVAGSILISGGVIVAVALWSFSGALTRSIAVYTAGAEGVIAVGLVLLAFAAGSIRRIDQ